MTDQEIKQAAIGALAKFHVATFLYRFDVRGINYYIFEREDLPEQTA